jgi:hypothetical protein
MNGNTSEKILSPKDGQGQLLAITASSTQSQVIIEGNVDVIASVETWIAIGTNPTAVKPSLGASGGGYFLVAGAPYRFNLPNDMRIAVIRDGSADGVLRICPVG